MHLQSLSLYSTGYRAESGSNNTNTTTIMNTSIFHQFIYTKKARQNLRFSGFYLAFSSVLPCFSCDLWAHGQVHSITCVLNCTLSNVQLNIFYLSKRLRRTSVFVKKLHSPQMSTIVNKGKKPMFSRTGARPKTKTAESVIVIVKYTPTYRGNFSVGLT